MDFVSYLVMIEKVHKKISKVNGEISKVENKKNLKNSFKFPKINFDLFKKFYFIVPIFFLCIAIFFTYDTRSGPINLDGLENRVESGINENVRNILSGEIDRKYPNLNEIDKNQVLEKDFANVLKTRQLISGNQTHNLDTIIESQKTVLKDSLQSPEGQTYLLAIDPYYFFRKSDNYITKGHYGDEKVDGVEFETLQLAPRKKETTRIDFHIWTSAKIMEFFGLDGNSTFGEKFSKIFILPVIFSIFGVIVLYFLIRKFTNDTFALLGTLLFATTSTFVSRTQAGFVDTDSYAVFFPILISFFAIYSIHYKNLYLKTIFSILTGLSLFLFAFAWVGYWFMVLFLLISFIGYIGFIFVKKILSKKNKIKDFKHEFFNVYVIGIIFLTTSFTSFIFSQKNLFYTTYNSIKNNLISLSSISKETIWPNVSSSVAELNNASFSSVVLGVGGVIVFLLAFQGILFALLNRNFRNEKIKNWSKILNLFGFIWFLIFLTSMFSNSLAQTNIYLFFLILFTPIIIAFLLLLFFGEIEGEKNIYLLILLCIWIAGGLFMSLNGVRFILLLFSPIIIAFSICLFFVTKYVNSFLEKEFSTIKKNIIIKNIFGIILGVLIFFIVFTPQVKSAYLTTENYLPNFDDKWHEAMKKVRENSSQDAIITSWWDFGHFFTAIGKRGVTFDGGSQETPQAYFVGRLLLENEINVSKDILRMLVCSGNDAFNAMQKIVNDETNGVHIIKTFHKTFGKSLDEKKEILKSYPYKNLTEKEVGEILEKLHCENPRENLLITSGDMIGKSGVWTHWGLWSFEKRYIYNNYKKNSKEKIAKSLDVEVEFVEERISELEEIERNSKIQNQKFENQVNPWFSGYPSYAGTQSCITKNTSFVCANGAIEINLQTRKVEGPNSDRYRRIIIPNFNRTSVVDLDENGTFDLTLLGSNQILISQYPLGNSLFTRLFYLNGIGVEEFEEFLTVQTQTTGKVSIWRTKFNESKIENFEIINSEDFEVLNNRNNNNS